MQWYVYLIAIPAAALLGQVAVELVGRPIRSVLRLRRKALERMMRFEKMALPRPRELAISTQAIHAYDQAARNLREAQDTFRDLGAQLLAASESEPTISILMNLLGLNIVLAGRELINLSEVYATVTTDGDGIRHRIGEALHAASIALAASRRRSRNGLIKIRLEPMALRDAGYPPNRRRPLGRSPMVARPAGRSSRRNGLAEGENLQRNMLFGTQSGSLPRRGNLTPV
jgi:hypothetical protein